MEKNARVEIGKTPSIHSGRVSETEIDGEAVCEDELEKKSSLKEDSGFSRTAFSIENDGPTVELFKED